MFLRHHIHSVMSTRDAMLPINTIISEAKKYNETFSICDHGSIAGWVELYNQCKKEEIKPIFGIEVYINKHRDILFDILKKLESCEDKNEKKELQTKRDSIKKYNHLVLLAKNKTGFHNIIELANIGYLNGFYNRPTITYDELFKRKEGIIVTSACIGNDMCQFIIKDQIKEAKEYAKKMSEELGDDFYLELQYNNIPEQKKVNEILLQFAKELNIKMITGMDSHYLNIDWKETHQDLLLLQGKNKKSDIGKKTIHVKWENSKGEIKTKNIEKGKEFRKGILVDSLNVGDKIKKDIILEISEKSKVWSFTGDAFYMSEKELLKYAKENHSEVKNVKETFIGNYEIPEKVEDFDLDFNIKLPTVENANKKLIELVKEGLITKGFSKKKKYVERAKFELDVIKDNGFSTYFLILADFIKYAKDNGIPIGAGRGSAVSSLIAYLLDIHRVNPLDEKWNGMPFERFLAVDRKLKKVILYDEKNNKKEFLETDMVDIIRGVKHYTIQAKDLKSDDVLIEKLN